MVIKIDRSDLYYKDYSWKVYRGDDPKITGKPDDELLNRKEGYEILAFINMYAEKHWFRHKQDCLKVEKMIRHNLPIDIRSRREIYNWIERNWHNY